MTQEALKLALEWIEDAVVVLSHTSSAIQGGIGAEAEGVGGCSVKVVTAIKEALRENAMREVQRLGQEIEQEPVVGITAIRTWFKDGRVVTQTLCNSWVDTAPPQRTWVGLTDEEENEYNYLGPDMHWVIQEIAAKLKEKNNA